MPRTQETLPETNATAYFLNDQGEVQKAEVNSAKFNEIRSLCTPFVITRPSKSEKHVTVSIPFPYLEAVPQSKLPELTKTIQKLSGMEAGEGTVRFEAVGIAKAEADKAAGTLLQELVELLKGRKQGK